MGLISNGEFLQQQAFLGSGYAGLVQVNSVMQSGLELVVASTDVEVEVDLLSAYEFNLAQVGSEVTSGILRTAMDALQRHITDGTGQSFNDYLLTRNLKVSQEFADLSAALGVTIKPVNVG